MDIRPLRPTQLQILLACELDPRPGLHQLGSVYHLRGELDVAALDAAVADVVARHPALRTLLRDTDDGIVQCVQPAGSGPGPGLRRQEVGGSHRIDPADGILRDHLVTELIEDTLDLYDEGPLRIHLLSLAAGEYLLVTVAHHVFFDAWSGGLLRRDLSAAYRSRLSGRAPWADDEDAAPSQHTDTATDKRERALEHWRAYMPGAPVGFTLPRSGGAGGTTIAVRGIPDDVWRGAAAVAARNRVTPFVVFLAAFSVVLSACTGRQEVLVGVPIAGRSDLASMETIGQFVNTLPFWCRVDPELPFDELLATVRARGVGLYRHSDVSLLDVAGVMDRDRREIGSAPHRITFNFLQTPEHELVLDQLAVRRLRPVPRAVDVDLSLWVEARQERPVLQLLDAMGGGSTTQPLLDRYLHTLDRVTAAPGVRVRELVAG